MVCTQIFSYSAALILILVSSLSASTAFAQNEMGKITSQKSVNLKPASSIGFEINPFFKDCRKVLPVSPLTAGSVILQKISDENYYMTAVLTARKNTKVFLRSNENKILLEPDTAGKINISTQVKIPDDELKMTLLLASEVGDKSQNFNFNVSIKGDQVQASLSPELTEFNRTDLCLRNQAWLGAGISIFKYSQQIEQIDADASFQSFQLGSYSLEVKSFPRPGLGVAGNFKSAVGKVGPGQVTGVTQTDFRWSTSSLELQYRSLNWSRGWKSWNVYPFVKAGFQNHSIPRITIDGASQVGFDNIEQLNVHVGAGVNLIDNGKSYVETYMNYQIPISSKNYSNSVKFMFDGSLGYGYAVTQKWTLGAFWYGQWHSFDYTPKSGVDTKPGTLDIFFSNIEFKVGYLF